VSTFVDIVLGKKRSSHVGLYAQQSEVIAGHRFTGVHLDVAFPVHLGEYYSGRRNTGEDLPGAITKILVVGVGKNVEGKVRIGLVNLDELFRSFEGKLPEKHGIDETEYGRVRSDT
jgi:hypothetical protein